MAEAKPREITIISGSCNPQRFELGDALLLNAEKKKLLAFTVDTHPFFEGMRGVAFLVRVRAVENLGNQDFKISGVTTDGDGVNHEVEVTYNFSTCRGMIKLPPT